MDVRVTVAGKELVMRKLRAYKEAIGVRTMAEIGYFMIQAANSRVARGRTIYGNPIKKSQRAKAQSGQTLSDSGAMLTAYKISSIGVGRVEVGFGDRTQALKALWHQYGTKPYEIEPTTEGGILAWQGFKKATKSNKQGKGAWAYATAVDHPGLPPRPVFGFGKGDEAKIRRIFKDALEREMREA